MSFYEYLKEFYGITWEEWDNSYSFSEGTGRQLHNEYTEHMEREAEQQAN